MNPLSIVSVVLGLLSAAASPALADEAAAEGARKEVGQTWIETASGVFGARPDERGAIGGGAGYTGIVTAGDYRVATLDELLDALAKASDGQVVFIDGNAEIDCTTRVHIEDLVLVVPAGVTLASDRGHDGSPGARVISKTFATHPLIRADGPRARITGIRLRGPNPDRHIEHHRRSFSEGLGRDYYYKFPVSNGIRNEHPGLQVDNCDISGWSHAGVFLADGDQHRIHHNFIHHNQYQGLGYGVCLNTAEALIEYNLFDFNRHSIAGTGRVRSGYEAANNVELGDSLSHCFDMHGGGDRGDGTTIAGTWMRIHLNTFRAAEAPIVIRGVPQESCRIYGNWFPLHRAPGDDSGPAAVHASENTIVEENMYGE